MNRMLKSVALCTLAMTLAGGIAVAQKDHYCIAIESGDIHLAVAVEVAGCDEDGIKAGDRS